jgi:hypothetical protein
MAYPDAQSGEQRFLDTVTTLAEDDLLSLLELALVREPSTTENH